MPPPVTKKNPGVGARCSVLKRFLHPGRLIQQAYPNMTFHERLEDLVAISYDEKVIRNKAVPCVVFRHDDFPNVEVYAHKRYVKVLEEGPAADFFNTNPVVDEVITEEVQNEMVEVPVLTSNVADDVERLRVEGYGVDDDNEPAPENVPNAPQSDDHDSPIYSEWGSRHFCNRRLQNRFQESATLNSDPPTSSRLDWFLKFLPVDYINSVLIPETNNHLSGAPLDFPEFLRFIGLLFLMATLNSGVDRRSFFEDTEPSEFEGAPFRLMKYMTKNRFESIMQSLRYTDIPSPQVPDKFHEIRPLITSFNKHMSETFKPSWISCLDESMSTWTSRWTCPGWMYVPRKPHPVGNEYHSICCGESGIMYAIEIVEGKDKPVNKVYEYGELGTTASLLLRLTKSIWFTGKVIILDSGFCVLKAIIELAKKGVYASALIKKRRFWPKYIDGESIKEHFRDSDPGFTDRLPGTWQSIPFDIFAMKEPEYVLMMMSTYGALIEDPREKISRRTWIPGAQQVPVSVEFKYKEVIGNHYRYRGAVDEHNSKRHDGGTGAGISLERSWKTMRWENRVFAFILAICEVNTFLAMSYFQAETEKQIDFKKKLCFELITYLDDVRNAGQETPVRRISRRNANHRLEKAPPYHKFYEGRWQRLSSYKYQTYVCKHVGCKKRIRTVCSCSRDVWRCESCFAVHFAESIMTP
jgi:hypothetical protein